MAEIPPDPSVPPAAEALWRAAVDKALKGAPFERTLTSRSADGFTIQPLYQRRADAAAVTGARPGQRWQVAARVDHPVAADASVQALADLTGGANALTLVFHGAPGARGFGLPTTTAADLDEALAGVDLDLITLTLEPAPQARVTARLFAEVVQRRGLDPSALDVAFGVDPIGLLARSGVLLAPWADIAARLCDMHREFAGFGGPLLTCDLRLVHEAGGSEGQELGYGLAAMVAYWRALEAGGITLADAARALDMVVAIDADQFMGMAKLRALRRLVARLQQVSGLAPVPVRLRAETAWRMLTRRDTPVNMLRNTIAAFAAGVGGADCVTVLPHTAALGLPDAFARRVARNTQAVLLEESHLWRVADPAAGSGGLEALTDALCAAGWAEFQTIEREGGLVAALAAGGPQGRIASVRDARARAIATGKAPLTGTSAFPHPGEVPEQVLAVEPQSVRAANGGAIKVEALPSLRLAEPFEALRDRADTAAAEGRRPAVFLARLGSAVSAAARIGFAQGLFAAGGLSCPPCEIEIQPDGSTDLIALTDAFKASGAALACLCGSDDTYGVEAADAAMALMASGATGVWLAGRPGEREAALRGAGVSRFVFAGCDMIEALSEAFDVATA